MTPTLYSYCLRFDSGAAPNPFGGTCTLVICKPAIRKAAQVGDWIVCLGSSQSPLGDISSGVVCAMQVTEKLTLKEYDEYCKANLSEKIPDWKSRRYELRVGDCIYDYSNPEPLLREGIHSEGNRETDLKGEYALLSNRFWYFGDRPLLLPDDLQGIKHAAPGHKSRANDPYFDKFIKWIEWHQWGLNKVIGRPQLESEIRSMKDNSVCARNDKEENDSDCEHI